VTVDTRVRLGDTTRAGAQWAANLLGPIAVLLGQELGYAFVDRACGSKNMTPVHLAFAGTILLALLGGVIAWREWRRWGSAHSSDGGDLVARSRFMLVVGALISAFSVLVLAAQWVATAFLNPCQ